jgi:ribose 5-phosphate isomerase A
MSAKERAARAAAELVEDGMIVGLGSGTTSALMVERLGERVSVEGIKILAVPTSVATAKLARHVGIPLRELDDVPKVDISLDGADEIDCDFRMIKGRGGALLREKIVASASSWRVTMITTEKKVDRLGIHAPVPVEVSPVGLKYTEGLLRELGAETSIRRIADGSPFLTDGMNAIVDCHFSGINNPDELDARLHCTVGVFESGLFIGLCDTLIIGHDEGIKRMESNLREIPTIGR